MNNEIEATFTGIDKNEIREKLKQVGAVLVCEERLMKRAVFDFPDRRMQNIGGWIRVRDEGDKVSSSYKQQNDTTLHGTIESQVIVNDYEAMCAIYEHIGLDCKAYQETKRESWKLDGVEIEIDTWPWVPPFLEVEGVDEEAVRAASEKLGLNFNDAVFGDVVSVYKQYYDIGDEELYHWEEIVFGPVPDWLEQKRINHEAT